MEQNVIIINAQNGQIRRKEVKPWFNEQNIYINQSQPLFHQLSYNKYQNNITKKWIDKLCMYMSLYKLILVYFIEDFYYCKSRKFFR